MQARTLFSALFAAVALAATGCATSQPAPPASYAGTRVYEAPPAPLVETVPPAPDNESYWIPGHWTWSGQGYAWSSGHWVQSRPGMVYQQAYWSQKDKAWTYHPGRWVAEGAPLVSDDVPPPAAVVTERIVVTEAPPAPLVEVIPVRPSPSVIWISGYWGWGGGRYIWHPGHWSGVRVGYTWAPGHWSRHGSGWRFSGNYWTRIH